MKRCTIKIRKSRDKEALMFTLKTAWHMVPISMKCTFMCLEVVFGKTEYLLVVGHQKPLQFKIRAERKRKTDTGFWCLFFLEYVGRRQVIDLILSPYVGNYESARKENKAEREEEKEGKGGRGCCTCFCVRRNRYLCVEK